MAKFDAAAIQAATDFVNGFKGRTRYLYRGAVRTISGKQARALWEAPFNTRTLQFVANGKAVAPQFVKGGAEVAVQAARARINGAALALQEGRIVRAAWEREMVSALSDLHGANAALARGGWSQMAAGDWAKAGDVVDREMEFLDGMKARIADGYYGANLERRGFLVHNGQYAESARATYENTRLDNAREKLGHERGRRILATVKNCDGCIAEAARGWVDIDEVAEIGSQECLCITTPHSRVLTQRGQIPIADIIVGDEVWTHRNRWRRVLAVHVNNPLAHHRQAYIQSPNGEIIGCTSDHKFLTPNGWQPLEQIGKLALPLYTMTHETMHSMQQEDEVGQDWRRLPNVRGSLPVREEKRLSRNSLQSVCKQSVGVEAVGESRATQNNCARHSHRPKRVATWMRRFESRFVYDDESGRTEDDVLLGRGWTQTICLPLPMDLGTGQRHHSNGYGSPPQKSRQIRRSDRELGVINSQSTSEGAFAGSAKGRMDVRTMWHHVQGIAARKERSAKILLKEVRIREELYDISVEDDHSFVLEGFVTHNSNCHCVIISATKGNEIE